MSEILANSVFDGRPERLAIGVHGPDQVSNYSVGSIEEMYLKLRADVYIDQTGILDYSSRRPDGTEMDRDDSRSAHFVSLENKLGKIAVNGCMRLARKLDDNSPLPVEGFFPDAFDDPATKGSVEVSRLIVHRDDSMIRSQIKKQLIANGLAYIVKNDLGPVYAVVEDNLKRDLESMGVPVELIAEPRYVEKYHSKNMAVEIDHIELSRRLGARLLDLLKTDYGSFNYFDA